MSILRARPENVATLSADALEALFAMERQLGRQEGYAAALFATGPTPPNSAMAIEFQFRYAEAAERKYPLPVPPERAVVA